MVSGNECEPRRRGILGDRTVGMAGRYSWAFPRWPDFSR